MAGKLIEDILELCGEIDVPAGGSACPSDRTSAHGF